MSGEPIIHPRRAVYAASLAVSAAVGGAVASLLAWRLGAGGETIGSIWLVTILATLLGAWPALIAGSMPVSRFGALVMAGSGMRLLATMGLGLALDLGGSGFASGERTAFWLGIVLAAVVVLIGDSAVAVSTLSRAGRARAGSGAGTGGGLGLESRSNRESA